MTAKLHIDPKAHCICWTGRQRAYFDSVPDALRRLMWITVRTVSKAMLREHLKTDACKLVPRR
jgi:hypothetical protein